jgi:catechol 2,3-dioxygenase-like lactoylglutathione lyase family enzyme
VDSVHNGVLKPGAQTTEDTLMLTTNSGFSGFSVNDQAAALTFYRDTLGLDCTETPMGLNLKLGGVNVFIYPKSNHEPATYTVLNFEVPDIDKAVDELTAAGVVLERYEGAHQDDKGIARGKAVNMGPDIAWFTDPAKNILAVLNG